MNNGISYTKRTRLNPTIAHQLKLRMEELGFHPEQHLHLGQLTALFAHHEWVMVTKNGNSSVTVYPSDKTLKDVISELENW